MSKMHLRPCPFCGAKVEDKWPDVTRIREGRWVVNHYCYHHPSDELGVSVNVYGSTKKEAVDRWNNRAEEGLEIVQELEFTRQFIHEHGLDFALASAWKGRRDQ